MSHGFATPPATPAKRSKRSAEAMEEDDLGHTDNFDAKADLILPFKQDSINCTIQQRRYIELNVFDNSESCYFLPLDWLKLYTCGLGLKGEAANTPRWAALVEMGRAHGFKFHSAGVTLHSIIPLQDILKTEAGTPIEQTTPNLQPYLEIMKDTNYQFGTVTFAEGTTLAKWLDNPQVATLFAKGAATNPEILVNLMGSLDTMKAGERKAFTMHPRDDTWFTLGNTGLADSKKINYLPSWGGVRTWAAGTNGFVPAITDHMRKDQHHGLFLRMTPVRDSNGAIMKFRCRISMDLHLNFSVRMPPQGAPGRSTQPTIYRQHLQTCMQEDGYVKYTVNHPF